MNEKLETFRSIVEAQTKARFVAGWERDGKQYPLEVHANAWPCTIKMGRKYANVDIGQSGKYMVELATGAIYGIKAYGVIHRGHYYGTLDTINEWDWSDYSAVRRQRKAA